MSYIGLTFILIIAFILLGSMTYFSVNVFNKLRVQNINIPEAVFLSFIYSISYLWSRGVSREDLEISRESIRKQVGPLFILIFGIIVIAAICIICVLQLKHD